MSTITLADAAKLTNNQLVQGIAETIIKVDPTLHLLPFTGVEGDAYSFNREATMGDVQTLAVGGTITATAPSTTSRIAIPLTTIVGQAEVNNMIESTMSDYMDQASAQIASKAKSAAYSFQSQFIVGGGAGVNELNGLAHQVASEQVIPAGSANGRAFDFEVLDELIDAVLVGGDKFFMLSAREIRTYMAKLRDLGGASVNEVMELPGGVKVPTYRGVPLFRNDFVPTNVTVGSSTDSASVYCGVFDDGSKTGILGLTAKKNAGLRVVNVGQHQSRDETLWRVVWYCGLAVHSTKALAVATGITPSGAAL